MKPMLAAATDGTNLSYPLMASAKLDGVRALVVDGVVMSRSLKPIPNNAVQKKFGRKEFNGFDGELIVGAPGAKDVYNKTVSTVMSHDGSADDVRFFVFDNFIAGSCQTFATRSSNLAEHILKVGRGLHVIHLGHRVINYSQDLLEFEQECLANGYEGVMIRRLDGGYKQGRSTLKEGLLLKLKRFEDSEAEVIGFTQLMHNANAAVRNELGQQERSSRKEGLVPLEKLGALKVRDLKTKVEFEIGTGFTDGDRMRLWKTRNQGLIGRLVKYKSQPVGVKEKPRFPVFLGFRDPIDL